MVPAGEAEGGAGNVARQLRAYGVDAVLVPTGHQPKVRVLAGVPPREVFRLDGVWAAPASETMARAAVEIARRTFSAAVYVDYQGRAGPAPGAAVVLAGLPRGECPLLVDARSSLEGWWGVDLLKMHISDAGLGESPNPTEVRAALERSGAFRLILTRGAAGHILVGPRWISPRPAVQLEGPVLNTSGAGDIFTATLAALVAGRPSLLANRGQLEGAAEIASRAAALRVRKSGYNEAVTSEEMAPWWPSGTPSP